MNFHCNKLIHSVSNSAKPIFLTISTKSYFYHSEVFPFPCCIRWSLFPYILRGSFSKSKIHPVIQNLQMLILYLHVVKILMGIPFPHTLGNSATFSKPEGCENVPELFLAPNKNVGRSTEI